MYSVGRRTFAVLAVAAAVVSLSAWRSPISAQEGDNFEGAIWQFDLTKKGRAQTTVKGRLRMSDDVVYQKEKPRDAEFTRKVGVNKPDGKKTRTEFKGLRAFDDSRTQTELNGVATLRMDGLGEWSGTFTDGDGANWEMKLSRVKE